MTSTRGSTSHPSSYYTWNYEYRFNEIWLVALLSSISVRCLLALLALRCWLVGPKCYMYLARNSVRCRLNPLLASVLRIQQHKGYCFDNQPLATVCQWTSYLTCDSFNNVYLINFLIWCWTNALSIVWSVVVCHRMSSVASVVAKRHYWSLSTNPANNFWA